MCRRLGEELGKLGHGVSLSDAPDPTADINHFMLFWWVPETCPPRSTAAVTHIDDSHRLELARLTIERTDLAICMSSMTVKQLVTARVPRNKLCYILPAIDGGVVGRRIKIGLTTRVYPDGRKREWMLERLAGEMDLGRFNFEIHGAGWERTIERLQGAGATVDYYDESQDFEADYRVIRDRLPSFDYYLYLGLDEGSMGTLDALAAGVPTIATPKGFHVDIPHGITYPWWEYSELREVFERIREERDARIKGVEPLTWRRYAENHATVWKALLEGRVQELPKILNQESLEPLGGYSANQEKHLASERRKLFLRTLYRYGIPKWRRVGGRALRAVLPQSAYQRLRRLWAR
jgi:hypothetical protein